MKAVEQDAREARRHEKVLLDQGWTEDIGDDPNYKHNEATGEWVEIPDKDGKTEQDRSLYAVPDQRPNTDVDWENVDWDDDDTADSGDDCSSVDDDGSDDDSGPGPDDEFVIVRAAGSNRATPGRRALPPTKPRSRKAPGATPPPSGKALLDLASRFGVFSDTPSKTNGKTTGKTNPTTKRRKT